MGVIMFNKGKRIGPRTPFGYWAAFRIPLIAMVSFIPVREGRPKERKLSRLHWIEGGSALCDFRYKKAFVHLPAKTLENPRFCIKCKRKLAKRKSGEKLERSRRL